MIKTMLLGCFFLKLKTGMTYTRPEPSWSLDQFRSGPKLCRVAYLHKMYLAENLSHTPLSFWVSLDLESEDDITVQPCPPFQHSDGTSWWQRAEKLNKTNRASICRQSNPKPIEVSGRTTTEINFHWHPVTSVSLWSGPKKEALTIAWLRGQRLRRSVFAEDPDGAPGAASLHERRSAMNKPVLLN